jgi:endonuclease/exonuclease/phosphatase (EEP) superfamily protein YafD
MTHVRQAAAWAAVVGMGATAVAPWTGPGGGKPLAVIRSLVPWSALSALPVAVGAAATGRRALALAAAAVGTAGLALAAPMVIPRRQPAADPDAAPLRITHANLLYVNRRVGAVSDVLGRLDADVVTFSELTPTHVRRLHATGLSASYPHQIELAADRASGAGLWSKWPLTATEHTSTSHRTIVADVHAPGGPVRVIVIHTVSPMHGHHRWAQDLDALADVATPGPAVMTGDFNASWWHPELRRLMRPGGWRDAHQAVGRGLSCSWPTSQWNPLFKVHPPFVRLDHALVNGGLRVLDASGFDVAGSDHLGVVVTVQRARPAAP